MNTILLVLLLIPNIIWAAGGHHGEGVPYSAIMWQFINVAMLFSGIFFMTRKSVIETFAKRKADYIAASEKSFALKQAAEQELKTTLENLSKLKATADDSIRRAHAEAADLKNNIIKEAQENSVRMRKEAQESAAAEVRRARRDLTVSFLGEAFGGAESELKKLNPGDRAKLQTQFVENMKVGSL